MYMTTASVVDPVRWFDILSSLTSTGALIVAVGVAVIESVRARNARKDRDSLLDQQANAQRRQTAKLVSAWVERDYAPNVAVNAYERRITAHIANQSSEPVFDVQSSIILLPVLGNSQGRALGPLAIPAVIPVLPPLNDLAFDLTIALEAHRDDNRGLLPDIPAIEIAFTDADQSRWVRETDGALVESAREVGSLFEAVDDSEMVGQIGAADLSNPLAVVIYFLAALNDSEKSGSEILQELQQYFAVEAEGWAILDLNGLADLRARFSDYSLGTHVMYPVPRVAYVRVFEPGVTRLQVVRGEGLVLRAEVVTLVHNPEIGWRIFAVGGGGTDPDRIQFASPF